MGEVEEACPDIEVIITIREAGKVRNSLEISINKSRFVKELKQSLATIPEVGIHPSFMRIWAGETELEDGLQICEYDIETDDELFLDNLMGDTSSSTVPITTIATQKAALDNAL